MQTKHLRQFSAALSAYLIALNFGAACSWASLSYEEFLRNSPISSTEKPLTVSQASLMVTFANVGGFIGTLLFLPLGEFFGHKKVIFWLGPLQIISWLILLYPQHVWCLYVGRILCGLAGGATNNCVPVFVAQISDYKIRGILNSLNQLCFSTGILLGFILGIYFDFKMQGMLLMSISVIFVCSFYFFPESPAYLKKWRMGTLLTKSNEFYYGSEAATGDDFEDGIYLNRSVITPNLTETNDTSTRQNLREFRNSAAKKATLITVFLVVIQQLSGNPTLVSYTASVFTEAASSLSVDESSAVIGLVQLLANITTFFVIKNVGNKVLFEVSVAGYGLGVFGLGLYNLYSKELAPSLNWIPIVSFSFAIFIGAIGLNTVPGILPLDILPLNIRNVILTICMSLSWIIAFVLNMLYPLYTAQFGMHGSLFTFAGICFVASILTRVYVPETRGKSYGSIMELMASG